MLESALSPEGLSRLLRVPHGCAEQTMFFMAPGLYAMRYLDETEQWDQLSPDRKEEGLQNLRTGQRGWGRGHGAEGHRGGRWVEGKRGREVDQGVLPGVASLAHWLCTLMCLPRYPCCHCQGHHVCTGVPTWHAQLIARVPEACTYGWIAHMGSLHICLGLPHMCSLHMQVWHLHIHVACIHGPGDSTHI